MPKSETNTRDFSPRIGSSYSYIDGFKSYLFWRVDIFEFVEVASPLPPSHPPPPPKNKVRNAIAIIQNNSWFSSQFKEAV